jgi:hypothetical protein
MDLLRAVSRRRASIVECAVVAAVVLAAWRLLLGWDWTTFDDDGRPGPWADTAANIRHATVVGLVAIIALLWLRLRGRAIIGLVLIFGGLVVLSGSRMATARGSDGLWPIGLGIFIVVGGVGAFLVAWLAALARRGLSGERSDDLVGFGRGHSW